MRRKKAEENKKPSAPFWMTTYGDMMSLLLVFFVLLFSFSTIDANKWKSIVLSFNGGLDSVEVVDDLPEDIPVITPIPDEPKNPAQSDEIDDFEQLYKQISEYVKEGKLSGQLDIKKSDTEILIRFRDNVIFDSGKADIRREAQKILGDIAGMLNKYKNQIDMVRIEGHTDNVPMSSPKYPSNWELSTARSVEVLRFFIEKYDFDPLKLSAVGYGEYHPVADNSTAKGRALNRRVDVVIAKAIDSIKEE